MGDLNYRLNTLRFDEILRVTRNAESLNRSNLHESLLKHDQLLLARKEKKAFDGFKEETISFSPTFKFVVGGGIEYDR